MKYIFSSFKLGYFCFRHLLPYHSLDQLMQSYENNGRDPTLSEYGVQGTNSAQVSPASPKKCNVTSSQLSVDRSSML